MLPQRLAVTRRALAFSLLRFQRELHLIYFTFPLPCKDEQLHHFFNTPKTCSKHEWASSRNALIFFLQFSPKSVNFFVFRIWTRFFFTVHLKSSVNFKSWFYQLSNNLACVAGSFVGERANKQRSSILLAASPFALALPNKTASYAATNDSALACVFQNSRKRFASPKN